MAPPCGFRAVASGRLAFKPVADLSDVPAQSAGNSFVVNAYKLPCAVSHQEPNKFTSWFFILENLILAVKRNF